MEALERRVTGRCRHGTVDACILPEKTMNDLPLRPATDIGAVEDRFFSLRNFWLSDGTVMPEATIAYETYGPLARDGRNAILCTHGYTGSHHFAGRNPANGNQPGSWDGLIGPIDTDKLFVVASNMLGSSFGSTNAGNINPQTGEFYGPDFPNITIRDIVAAGLGAEACETLQAVPDHTIGDLPAHDAGSLDAGAVVPCRADPRDARDHSLPRRSGNRRADDLRNHAPLHTADGSLAIPLEGQQATSRAPRCPARGRVSGYGC